MAAGQRLPEPTPPESSPIRAEDLPPPIRLGARVATVRAQIPVISAVVLVPDSAAYITAVGSWTLGARFPVLIDDGSWGAKESIARFARAFKPERVVRFSGGAALPEGEGALRAAVEGAASAAWECAEPGKLAEHWKKMGFAPPGVVVAHPSDPAWTGALALAAGHGQPLVWLNARPFGTGLADWYPAEKLDELTVALQTELGKMPWKWDEIGDEIDAVTLCQNGPVKVTVGAVSQTTTYAVSDALGRSPGVLALTARDPKRAARWAWAGQVIGNESQAAYVAMCSLFLSPERAWLFDGYEDSPPWNGWDATPAASLLQRAGIPALLDDGARQGIEDWRKRGAGRPRGGDPGVEARRGLAGSLLANRRGVEASLIFVNTSGNAEFFDLKPGQGRPDDVPVLSIPAAVHFVHSWSATSPGNRDTVGGRWLERGAFAYMGSVYEPYLQAFVPTSLVSQRLLVAAPFGAAVRLENAEPWKVAVIGDPLYVVARPVSRAAVPLPGALSQATSIADDLSGQLRSRDFAAAVNTMRLLGRDQEAARLLGAIIKDQPDALTAEVALAGLGAAFFELEPGLFARVYAAALPRILGDETLAACKDFLWHATFTRGTDLTPLETDLLSQSLRPGCLARDAAEAARAVYRTRGPEAAAALIARAKSMAADEAIRAEIAKWAP